VDNKLGTVCQSLSAKPLSLDQINIRVFPNPVRSNLNVELNFDGEKKVEILSSNGQKLASKSTENTELEVVLPEGIRTSLLLLKVTTQYGVVTKKVMRIED